MKTLEAIVGVLILGASVFLFWHNYNLQIQCNSWGGQVSNFFSSILGASAVQACYNSSIIEVGSIISAIIGGLIVYFATSDKHAR